MSTMEIIDLKEIANDFVKQVIPEDASEIQKNETKKAFYCGLIFGFRLPTDMIDLSDEEETMKHLTAYNIQLAEIEKALSDGIEI